MGIIKEYRTTFNLLPQIKIPICGGDEPTYTCNLGISSLTVSDVTLRGADDGSITVGISGQTGTTHTWALNGVNYYTGGTLRTFSGLASGYYTVTIEQNDECIAYRNNVIVYNGDFRTGTMLCESGSNIQAVNNPILHNIQTALNDENGKKAIAQLYIQPLYTVNQNDYIQFELTSPYAYTVKFQAKNFPNKPNYFLTNNLLDDDGLPSGTNEPQEIALSLAEALQNDLVMNSLYFINYDGSYTIMIEAKENGSKYDLNIDNVTKSCSGITFNTIQNGIEKYDGELVDNYSVWAELWLNPNNYNYPNIGQEYDYKRIIEKELPFNVTNNHIFDFSDVLKNFVTTSKPNPNSSGFTLQTEYIKSYKLKYGEKYPLIANSTTIKKRYKGESEVKWVCNAALSKYDENDMTPYLGIPETNLNPDFRANMRYYSTGDTITITNYIVDEDRIDTTNIQFKIDAYNSSSNLITYGWQTSPDFVLDAGYYNGEIHISGITDGITYTFTKYWVIVPGYGYTNLETDFENVKTTDVKFLTHSPNPKQIQRNSQEYLYFILPKDYGYDLQCNGDIYLYDGTVITGNTFFSLTNANNQGGILAMNLSYDKLGLSAIELTYGSKVKKVEVALYHTGGNNYTEVKTYKFNYNDKSSKLGLLFENSLGGYDTFDFVGINEDSITRVADTYTKSANPVISGQYAEGYKSKTEYNVNVIKTITVNSGWIDELHFDWLIELLKSNNIYTYTTDKQYYVLIKQFQYKKNSQEKLFDVELTLELSDNENTIND